jgi:hypothetical protein
MNDEQFKELIRAIESVSWQLKRLADFEEEKQKQWLRELEPTDMANLANIEKLKSLMKRKD